jgi:trimeric autotransporter adhesin
MNRSPVGAFLLIPFVLVCFALSPQARAVCQEGCFSIDNTVLGDDALLNNTGFDNTAIGSSALLSNTTGTGNAATGSSALLSNTTGSFNTANGLEALYSNTTGGNNTATGAFALLSNTTGFDNTANGYATLVDNTTGSRNTANGVFALAFNTTGNRNTANGVFALYDNRTGNSNIALGFQAGMNITGSSNIDIGNDGVAGESRTIRVGTQGRQTATYIAGISGATVPTGVAVIVDSSGHLGTTTSSARFKDAIKPMDKASEAILALKPVSFHYKPEINPESIPQFGLVAEDVEKVNSDLVARDAHGKPYTVRYEAVNAMLLNEFLKEHKTVQKQGATIAVLKKEIAALTATVKEQAAQIQKVSADLGVSKTARQIAARLRSSQPARSFDAP